MSTQRILLSLLFVLILFSCSRKKPADVGAVISIAQSEDDSNKLHKDPALNLNEYSNTFMQNITEKITLQSGKATVITGKKGLRLTVNSTNLESADGEPVAGDIDVTIVELTNGDDLFKANAATVSDGRLLASGGSYFIGMESAGQTLHLKNGKSIQVEFPVIKKEGMELFYGERDQENNMNWKRAGRTLEKQYETVDFKDSYGIDDQAPDPGLSEAISGRVFKSLEEPVFYYKKQLTVQQLVDTLNKSSCKVYLETISFWPKNLRTDVQLDTNFLVATYGPRKQYIVRSIKAQQLHEEALAIAKAKHTERIEKWQPKTIAGQIQKYYAPQQIGNLGWINCDRFYENNEKTEMEMDIPIALKGSRIQYFIIYKNFNGLYNGYIDFDNQSKLKISNLPAGEPITLVAFAKNRGMMYQLKQDLVTKKDLKPELHFKSIDGEEMKKIFGANVRI